MNKKEKEAAYAFLLKLRGASHFPDELLDLIAALVKSAPSKP